MRIRSILCSFQSRNDVLLEYLQLASIFREHPYCLSVIGVVTLSVGSREVIIPTVGVQLTMAIRQTSGLIT